MIKKDLRNILLVDDDDDNNFIHKIIIKESGFDADVVSVLSAKEALDLLISGEKPDLIFLDINMPVLNGWDFLNEYRNLPEEKKKNHIIIMLTSSVHIEDEKKAKNYCEISEYKTKPLTIPLFKELISKYFS